MTFSPRVWRDAMRRLQQEMPDFVFDAWIAPIEAKIDADRLVLGCPTSFHRDRIRLHYLAPIKQAVRAALGDAGETGDPRSSQAIPADPTIELLTRAEFSAAPGHAIEVELPIGMRRVDPISHARPMRVGEPRPLLPGGRAPGRATVPSTPSSSIQSTPSPSIQSTPSTPASPSGPTAGDRAATGRSTEAGSGSGSEPDRSPGADSHEGARARDAAGGRPTLHVVPGAGDAAPGRKTSRRDAAAGARPLLGLRERDATGGASFGLRGEPQRRHDDPFTFETFVTGPCNALAREAALALARRRQRSLNAIYLAGLSGMGKTHLARATVNEALRQLRAGAHAERHERPDAPAGPPTAGRVLYTTAEQFTSDFVSAMRNGRNDAWAKRYRGPIDLLVVEDIQLLDGRSKTQQELGHTIAHVLERGGRVLLTGDRAPRDLTGLDARLRTLISRSFLAELDRPDPIVRRHILRAKADAGGVRLPEACLDALVDATEHGPGGASVVDLESLLIQVVTTASLSGRPIDLDLVQEAVALKAGHGAELAPRQIAVTEIVQAVAGFFGKRPEALAARSRRRDVLFPRQLAMYLAHRYTNASLTEIGRALGRDHPAVRNAIQRIERQLLESAPVRYQVEALCEKVDALLAREPEK